MKQIIHINQHHIKWNRKHPDEDAKPVITCKTYKDNQYHHGSSWSTTRVTRSEGSSINPITLWLAVLTFGSRSIPIPFLSLRRMIPDA